MLQHILLFATGNTLLSVCQPLARYPYLGGFDWSGIRPLPARQRRQNATEGADPRCGVKDVDLPNAKILWWHPSWFVGFGRDTNSTIDIIRRLIERNELIVPKWVSNVASKYEKLSYYGIVCPTLFGYKFQLAIKRGRSRYFTRRTVRIWIVVS